MSENEKQFDLDAAETAYAVIASYVEHTQIAGIILAMLAGALGEEKLKVLVETEHWKNYMASKRTLEAAKEDIEKLSQIIAQLRT